MTLWKDLLHMLTLPALQTKYLISQTVEKITLVNCNKENSVFLASLPQNPTLKPVILSYINAHAFNLMHIDSSFCQNLLDSDILLRDGIGISILLRTQKIHPGINMNGTCLTPLILNQFKNKKIALCGTSIKNLGAAKSKLLNEGYTEIFTLDGFQEDEIYSKILENEKPALIILGMGMPKQERVAILLKKRLSYPCLIVNSGAAIDYISGCIPRAPLIVRKLRSEWIYRLFIEPKRLCERYLIGNIVFLVRILHPRCLKKAYE